MLGAAISGIAESAYSDVVLAGNTGSSVADLSDVILLMVFRWLLFVHDARIDAPIAIVACVCRRWREISRRVHISKCLIQSLLPELLSVILYHAAGDFRNDPRMFAVRRMKLGKVCRTWRDVSRSDPWLWSFVYADNRTALDIVGGCIDRSGQLDLSVHLNFLPSNLSVTSTSPFIRRFLERVGPAFSRLRSFSIHSTELVSTTALFAALTSVHLPSIMHPDFQLSPASLLAQIAYEVEGGLALWKAAHMYSTLDMLVLEDLSFECVLTDTDLYTVLQAAPLLRVLVAVDVCCHETLSDKNGKTLAVLSRLTHLRFKSSSPSNSLHWLSRLAAPVLRVLSIDVCRYYFGHSQFFDSARHLFGGVTTFIMDNYDFFSTSLKRFLVLMPNLERLDGRGSRRMFVDDVHEMSSICDKLCLRLVEIYFGTAIHDMTRCILHLIFQYFFGGFVADFGEAIDKRRNIIGWVCSRWRALILDDPHMWSNIYTDNRTSTSDLSWWIERSKTTDITLYIHLIPVGFGCRSVDRLLRNSFEVLRTALPRCKRIAVHASDGLSADSVLRAMAGVRAFQVELLHLHVDVGSVADQDDEDMRLPLLFEGCLPMLRTLCFSAGYVSWPPTTFYANLDTLHLADLSWDCSLFATDLTWLLSCTSSLRVLVVVDVDCEVGDDNKVTFEDVSPTVSMSRLTHLRFQGSHHTSSWIALIDVPRLRTLELIMDHKEDNVQRFAAACHRVLPLITTLIFSVDTTSHHALFEYLKVATRLVRLDGRAAGPVFADAIHDMSVSFDELCPVLRSVYSRSTLTTVPLRDIFSRRAFSSFSADLHLFLPLHRSAYASRFILYDTWMNLGQIERRPASVPCTFFDEPAIDS
ncbi:hypothetical protein C8J57DRAFT_1563150 [Mycena rebaudengoi]|nr:hypothetical protein C8J57DRAFT_1563150 [Mycena rebaudengoi]